MTAVSFLRVVFKFSRELFRYIRHREQVEDTEAAANELADLEEDLDDLHDAEDVSEFGSRFFD